MSRQICCCRVRQLLCTKLTDSLIFVCYFSIGGEEPKCFKALLLRCFGVLIVLPGRLCSLVSSIFIANDVTLLAELIGQGSIGQAVGQADSEVLEGLTRWITRQITLNSLLPLRL